MGLNHEKDFYSSAYWKVLGDEWMQVRYIIHLYIVSRE